MFIKLLGYIQEKVRRLFMGRPRKDDLNFKEQQLEVQEADEVNGNVIVEVKQEVVEPVFERILIGWTFNPETGLRRLVECPISDDLKLGTPKVISEEDGRDIISERFRIKASEIL